jgi:putative cell wall-binding protein
MGTALIAGAGTGSAATAPAAPVTAITLSNNENGVAQATTISQNTQANQNSTGNNATGVGAGWQFTLTDNWKNNDVLAITLAPSSGTDCQTPTPQGVNQSLDDPANFVGFSDFQHADIPPAGAGDTGGNLNSIVGPAIWAISDGQEIPAISESESGPIDCSSPGATTDDSGLGTGPPFTTFSTLDLTLHGQGGTNGANNGSTITIHVGAGIGLTAANLITGSLDGPVLLNAGFGASTGPITTTASYGGSKPTIVSDATVVGETPAANNPRTGLVRDTSLDTISGGISNFTITEGPANSLPPTNDVQNINPGVTQNPSTVVANDETESALVSGDVCVVIDNHDGSNIKWGSVAGGAWTANPGASQSSFSAQAGAASVVTTTGGYTLQLPVVNSSNVANTVWTAAGLNLSGLAYADGPVWAYVYWISNGNDNPADPNADCSNVATTTAGGRDTGSRDGFTTSGSYDGDFQLGYVQLATVTEQADSIFGDNADATSSQALEHQFDYAHDACVSNQDPHFNYGPSVFLASDADYHDALGADYAAGTIDSGVLLTSPSGLDAQTLDAIRLEGVSTVFVAGGPLSIPAALVTQLEATPSYNCGGTEVKVNSSHQLEDLNVIRVFGQTALDTDQQLAEFIGAEPIDQSQPYGDYGTGNNPFNDTTGASSTTVVPTASVGVNTALLVTDATWQDAVVASVPGYNDQLPVIMTDPAALSIQAQDAIFNDHIGQVIVVGGPESVSDNVLTQLNAQGIGAIRIAGSDASDTSVQLASFELAHASTGTAPNTSPVGIESDNALDGFSGYDNEDQDWLHYVDRTAGRTDSPTRPDVAAHTVILASGAGYQDALSAAVLSIHNGFDLDSGRNNVQFPLILTESATSLGTPATTFLHNAGFEISKLAGEVPAGGLHSHAESGHQNNYASSSVFTVQPIGGPLSLTPATIAAAVAAIPAP